MKKLRSLNPDKGYPFLIIIVLILLGSGLPAQNVISFSYDAAGNRTERKIFVATKTLSQKQIPDMITETISKREIKFYSSIQGQITVEISTLDGMINGTITIFTITDARPILSRKIKNTREDLDISRNSAGVYVLLVDINGERTSYKLIKN